MVDGGNRNRYVQGMSNVRTERRGSPQGPRDTPATLRIGELARRAGVPTATLRAWERRYGVVSPKRSSTSGYRLYTDGDERRLRAMTGLIEQGLAPAEAAERVRAHADFEQAPASSAEAASASVLDHLRSSLLASLIALDDEGANRELDRAAGSLALEAFLGEVLLPVLREIGERWARGEARVHEEHFTSALIRSRLLGMARGWGSGSAGELALLACPGGERHDLGLICFGLMLHSRGRRIAFLGADTPTDAILACAHETAPERTVLFALVASRFEEVEPGLAEIASVTELQLAGPDVPAELCSRVGASRLAGDPLSAAAQLG